MAYEWKQTIFTPEDFEGSGQYIVRECRHNKLTTSHIENSGYLSTIMYKIGYLKGTRRDDYMSSMYALVSMSDGWIQEGYFTNTELDGKQLPTEQWVWNRFAADNNFEAKMKLCEYLNNNPSKDTYRKATVEELIRVALHQQRYRTA